MARDNKFLKKLKHVWHKITFADDIIECEERIKILENEVDFFAKLLNEETEKNRDLMDDLEGYKQKFAELQKKVEDRWNAMFDE